MVSWARRCGRSRNTTGVTVLPLIENRHSAHAACWRITSRSERRSRDRRDDGSESAGGAGVLHERTRRMGSWWSSATLIAVFPANVHMALHPDRYRMIPGGRPALIARLPVQVLFIAWAHAAGK